MFTTSRRSLLLAWLLAAIVLAGCQGGRAEKTVLVVLPLTGPAATWGDHFNRGVEMFRQTVKDPRITVRVVDSASNPAEGRSAVAQAALRGKPFAVVSTLSSVTVPLKDWAKEEGVFLVACVVTDRVLDGSGRVQRIYPSVEDNTRPLIDYAVSRFSRVAIMHSNEELGSAVKRLFEKAFVGNGRTVVAEPYNLRETDVRNTVAKVISSRSDAVLLTGIGPAFWAAVREFRAQRYAGELLSDVSFADPTQIAELGAAADGVVFTGSETELTDPRTDEARSFNRDFKSRFGVAANYTGITVYEALRTLDRLALDHSSLSSNAFAAMREWNGVPGAIRFLPNGDSRYPWFLIRRSAGRSVPFQPGS